MLANNTRMFYQGTMCGSEELSRLTKSGSSSFPALLSNMQGQWLITGKRAPVKLSYRLDYDAMTSPSPVIVSMIQQQVLMWVSSLGPR